jgi:hypothetical protein
LQIFREHLLVAVEARCSETGGESRRGSSSRKISSALGAAVSSLAAAMAAYEARARRTPLRQSGGSSAARSISPGSNRSRRSASSDEVLL